MSVYNLKDSVMQKNQEGKPFRSYSPGKGDFSHVFGNLHRQDLKLSREFSFISPAVIFHFNNMSVGLFGKFEKKNAFSFLRNICATFYSLSKTVFTLLQLSS